MTKIALILPYFGTFGNYFSLFLESCRYNRTIDFLLFTDDKRVFNYPDNVKVKYLRFDELKNKIIERFGTSVRLDKPYKLCDFKPAYGEIFQEYIAGYDFWGYCDCDLIFGNLRAFLTDDVLRSCGKIFTRGHLTLYKNTPAINSIYRTQKIIDWDGVIANPKNQTFDEWNGISYIWDKLGHSYYDKLVMDDIVVGKKGLYPTKTISGRYGPYNNDQNPDESKRYKRMKCIVYTWQHGVLKRNWIQRGVKMLLSEEIAYIHLQKRRMVLNDGIDASDGFIISGNKFLRYEYLNRQNIKRISSNRFYFNNLAMEIQRNLKRIIKTLLGKQR